MRYFTMIMIFIMNMSCKHDISISGYIRYQTFDEYTLKGTVPNEKVKYPCVFIKQTEDTIFVIKSDKSDKTLKYINKGDYWYCIDKRQREYLNGVYYIEKFIFNDTLLIYEYTYLDSVKYPYLDSTKENFSLTIETKKEIINIIGINLIEQNRIDFHKVKKVAANYKNTIPYYSHEYQPSYYESYTKVFKNEKLYLYENKGTDELVCLKDIRQLNSLGEFDSQKGVSIIDRIQDKNKCK